MKPGSGGLGNTAEGPAPIGPGEDGNGQGGEEDESDVDLKGLVGPDRQAHLDSGKQTRRHSTRLTPEPRLA